MVEKTNSGFSRIETLGQIRFEMGAWNLPSIKHKESQDSVFRSGRDFGVFDGVSGAKNGAEASAVVAETIGQSLRNYSSPPTSIESARKRLLTAYSQANRAILRRQKITDTDMDTTGVFGTLISTESGDNYAVFVNSGDSRLYLFSNGSLIRETRDHNHIYDEYFDPKNTSKYDRIQDKLDNYDGSQSLSPQEKVFFSLRHDIGLTVGSDTLPDVYFIPIKSGDILLLTTDGVSDNFTHNQLESFIEKHKNMSPQSMSQLITSEAQILSLKSSQKEYPRAKFDDMTALVIKISG